MEEPKRIPSDHRTYGKSRAVRLPDFDYSSDVPIHLTFWAPGAVLLDSELALIICGSVETCSHKMGYTLFGYCLMPDHLHVLLSPAASGLAIDRWLHDFKSYTTNRFMKLGGSPPLWQRSGHDHICRENETAESVLFYIANNPIRRGLVDDWQKWPWTRVFIKM
jgi:REP element-mobilizing transposase RayT